MYNERRGLIIGFHGCDQSKRDALLIRPYKIHKSEKPHDWLGHGVYFWENNLDRAWKWARDKEKRGEIEKAAVIGAVLSLDHCFDLLDNRFIDTIQEYYQLLKSNYEALGKKLPENKDARFDNYRDIIIRELDCAVIELMHKTIENKIILDENSNGFSSYKRFDSVRGVFIEGGPAYPGAGIRKKSHIQICIRNPNCIKGFFLPRTEINFP